MEEIYVSWSRGLPQDKEALRILRESGLVSGIETSNIDGQFEMIKDADLKVSLHTPGVDLTSNLANPNYVEIFDGEQGNRLLYVIRNSDASTVGFHCGYSVTDTWKIKSYRTVPKPNSISLDRSPLLDMITKNLIALENLINNGISQDRKKQVIIESQDYCREFEKPIDWDIQTDEVRRYKAEIEKIISQYGVNAVIEYVTDADFIKELLELTRLRNIKPVGFLFDVGHTLISADTKIHERKFLGSIEDYFNNLLNAVNGETYQLHINVPNGDEENGYLDVHKLFVEGEGLSEHVLDLTNLVIARSPKLKVMTLEMTTGLEPVQHAREMLKQAEYLSRKLNL